MMKVEHYTPAGTLKPYIKSYTFIATAHETETIVLPHRGLVIAIPYLGHVSYQKNDSVYKISSAILSGMRKTFRRFRYEKNTENILITFTETGASAFFKEPINELFENFNSLDIFFRSSETGFFEERIASAKNNQQRINIVEQFLLSKLIVSKPDDLVISTIQQIYLHHGALTFIHFQTNLL